MSTNNINILLALLCYNFNVYYYLLCCLFLSLGKFVFATFPTVYFCVCDLLCFQIYMRLPSECAKHLHYSQIHASQGCEIVYQAFAGCQNILRPVLTEPFSQNKFYTLIPLEFGHLYYRVNGYLETLVCLQRNKHSTFSIW